MRKEVYSKNFPDYSNFNTSTVTLGALDMSACILYLNCSRESYKRDYDIFCSAMISQGYLRTFFHELTHYFQINTTPNGKYIVDLEDFQIVQVQQIIQTIGNIKYPIISDMIKNHTIESNERAWYHLRKWYAAELLKSAFNCDFKRYKYLSYNTVFSEEKLSDIFCEIDAEMSRLFEMKLVKRKLTNEGIEMSQDLEYAIKNEASPFENHARIAEFWWEPKNKVNPYRSGNEDLFQYSGLIEAFSKRVHIDDFQDFVSSFLAICELAQFSPLLPGMDCAAEVSIYDYIPIYRIARLIDIAKEISPVRGINDYNRYVNELANKANYTPVAEVCECILKNRVQLPGKSFWVDLFYDAIQIRSNDFSTFSYYGLWHPLALNVEPIAKSFTQRFCPPLICYNDCNYSRTNSPNAFPDEAFSIVIRNIFRKYVSAIMTGWERTENGKLLIPCPVIANAFEKQYIESQVNSLIEKRLYLHSNLKII